MGLPLSVVQYFALIKVYNLMTWPVHVVFYALALLLVGFAARGSRATNVGLAFLWIWAGAVYFIRLMAVLTPAGYVAGGLFIVQAVLLLKVEFSIQKGTMPSVGGVLVAYVMAVYPVLGSLLGHGWPMVQMMGLPAPTAIFTLGLLLWAAEKVPAYTLVIPLLCALAGLASPFLYGTYEDIGLFVAGIAALSLFRRKRVSPLEARGEIGPTG